MQSETVIVTGSTSGIGLELSRLLVSGGRKVLGIGRRPCPEDFLKNPLYEHLTLDFCSKDWPISLDEFFEAKFCNNDISGFVHCSGSVVLKNIVDSSDSDLTSQVSINLTSVLLILKRVLPLMCDRGGKVVLLGSRGRRFPFANGAAYCASKAGLHAINDCLALEMKNEEKLLGTTIIEFGTVQTGFGGVESDGQQISARGAASRILKLLDTEELEDFDQRVIEIVPSVKRRLDG